MVFVKGWKKKKSEPVDEIAELERIEQEARTKREELESRKPVDVGVSDVEIGGSPPVTPEKLQEKQDEQLNPDVKRILEDWQRDYQQTLSSGVQSMDYVQRDTTNTLLLMLIAELRKQK